VSAGRGEVGGHRRFADAALAGENRDDRPDVAQPRRQPRVLGLDLADDVGAAVASDVAIALHVANSTPNDPASHGLLPPETRPREEEAQDQQHRGSGPEHGTVRTGRPGTTRRRRTEAS
jgi:hypothetical protein